MANESQTDNATTKVCSYCHKAMVGDHKDCPGAAAPTAELAGQPPLADPLVGTTFADKYEIMSVLGKGGMSLVYKARHKFMDRIVAVKVLLEHLVSDTGAVQRFQQESKAASTLSHQNVVTVFDFGQTPNGQAYFVMDCLEGESLADCIEHDGRIEVRRALDIFEQICDGLDHAHKKGIIHRDLKPNNIVLMRGENGQEYVKIVDFGIAKILGTDGSTPQQRLTQTGEIFGSPFYMSPEQCQGFPLDARSDLYSLGCLMYETLTGFPPQMGESFVATALKHINDAPPSFAEIAPSAQLPKQVEAVVLKCLEKAPRDRYASADYIKQALMDAALAAGVPGLRAGAVKVTAAQSPMRQTWDKLSKSLDTGSYKLDKTAKKAVSVAQLFLAVVPLALLIIGGSVAFYYPGPDGDKGTPWNKLQWQFAMENASKAADHRDLGEVQKQIAKALAMTNTFGDNNTRKKATYQLAATLYEKLNDFSGQSAANKEVLNLTTEEIRTEAERAEKWLLQMDKPENGIDETVNSAGAQANANRVLMTSRRLHARGLYEMEEKLLRSAVKTFNHLGLGHSEPIAEFKTSLADCFLSQQKLTEVRPRLLDALKIRETLANAGDGDKLPVVPADPNEKAEERSSLLNLVKSCLKIGEFDRDQSDFEEATTELNRAKQLIDAYFKKNEQLNSECDNSIADLQRQIKRDRERDSKRHQSAS